MNWLAHLLLSEPTAEYRLGNLLPDFGRINSLRDLPEAFQLGIRQHRRIDAFTDAHPVVKRSVARLPTPLRRYGPIIVDIFYDHFLTVDWALHSDITIRDLASEVYASIEEYRKTLSPEVYERLAGMRDGDWICSYHDIWGIELTLTRISGRFRRPVNLGEASRSLEQSYADFQADFREFFPELQDYAVDNLEAPGGTDSQP